jgi:methylthioribose-1-phosphate isomerase
MSTIVTMEFKDEKLYLIEQRKLPTAYEHFICTNYKDVEYAIKEMVVRGAPAIGDAAAFGAYLAACEFKNEEIGLFKEKLLGAIDFLEASRPTAVNLMWALNEMRAIINTKSDQEDIVASMLKKAYEIHQDDIDTSLKISKNGNSLIKEGMTILTHCNTGALAVAGYGTALGVIREAHYTGKNIFVYADETRPRCQGGRLTAWELIQEKIPAKLIVDSVAATLIRDGKIDVILVGADRIAANGDSANKIGTFMLSVVAKAYNVPFYIVAPRTTIDFETPTGDQIEIEERSPEEVTHIQGVRIAPEGIEVYNPAFDVTPWENITGIVTEFGVITGPYTEKIQELKNK